ncbi:GIY-YIG nuclease family protein [Bradyrhizobium sp. UNPA324]|uniref:GIY-YIG nuclease family protein n=1 Tax=Bradyrhizobium sp. UNPA324 TaxID=1141174 RepID=UPI0015EECE42
MGARGYYAYILASTIGGTLYIGVTNDLIRRVAEHKLQLIESFTKEYGVVKLVYFRAIRRSRECDQAREAAKEWKRDWKIALIEKDNPDWNDLYPGIAGPP